LVNGRWTTVVKIRSTKMVKSFRYAAVPLRDSDQCKHACHAQHAQPRAGHPRLIILALKKDVDGRDVGANTRVKRASRLCPAVTMS
jgi:hypothetical protein